MRIKEILKKGILLTSDEEIDIIIISDKFFFYVYGGNQHGDYELYKQFEINEKTLWDDGIEYLYRESRFILNDIKTDFFEGQYNECNEN